MLKATLERKGKREKKGKALILLNLPFGNGGKKGENSEGGYLIAYNILRLGRTKKKKRRKEAIYLKPCLLSSCSRSQIV